MFIAISVHQIMLSKSQQIFTLQLRYYNYINKQSDKVENLEEVGG